MLIIDEHTPTSRIILDLDPITTIDQYERLVELLVSDFGGAALERLDGPDASSCKITINEVKLELRHYSSLGNSIITDNPAGRPVLEQIKNYLENLLEGISLR